MGFYILGDYLRYGNVDTGQKCIDVRPIGVFRNIDAVVHKNKAFLIRQANTEKAAVGAAFFDGTKLKIFRTQMIG
ncbi:MAG: hypothetical protein A4E71_01492 [Smithella sp. PtaU1.Bin162]|nr:MAG: hypothetical protein A4E71_01492 [Smithella sp. PtaU1.Bin162]